ncbi:dihydrodipicolinate synthase family protein [Puniceibacterium confluentis]|uniref:dihydrodipicolinate synthase family protein n=1 Tax=Puniceibacterium confluentis TaxID=1958944 RepID=UPI0011B6760D|nr:dihydrodipicolinate synthase family protein [Puniceibacterium confluentis]
MPTGQRITQRLHGISGILVTPFDRDDCLEMKKLRPIIDRSVEAGIHILVANGNTGEFYALTTAEAEAYVAAAAEMLDGRAPLLAGVGRSVGDAVALTKASVRAGAEGLMIHQPPDPFVSPRGIVDYISRIRDVSDGLPLMLYLRNDTIGTANIAALCAIEGVAGVKWATPNPLKLAEAMKACPDHIVWVGGLAEVWAPTFYAVGARGFTSGLINVWPERSMEIHAALEAGDCATARARIADMEVFEDIRAQEMNGTNVTGVKTALQMIGLDCGPTRPPSAWPLTNRQSEALGGFLRDNGLLQAQAS